MTLPNRQYSAASSVGGPLRPFRVHAICLPGTCDIKSSLSKGLFGRMTQVVTWANQYSFVARSPAHFRVSVAADDLT